MIKSSKPSVSKKEEFVAFYNRYLALGNDESLLYMLINHLSNMFISKVEKNGPEAYLYDLDKDLMELRYTKEDMQSLCNFAKSCLKFYPAATIKLQNGNVAYIDKFGTIVTFENNQINSEYIGKNIFELVAETQDYKARKDAMNVILQNILVCKLYLAISEDISKKSTDGAVDIFNLINESILTYEKKLVEHKKSIDTIHHNYVRVRSER